MAAGPGEISAIVQEILASVPRGCTWLRPLTGADGRVTDFEVAATSGEDLFRRGAARVGAHLRELYPSMVGGPLWALYEQVLATGEPASIEDFAFRQAGAGVVADSNFEVSVHPVLGGLLVWWERVDEARRRLDRTEQLGSLGWSEHDLVTGRSAWSPGMFRLFERDPALGPPSRAEQAAMLHPDDLGVSETAWQTLDSGAGSDVTMRFQVGGGVKHVRVLADVARDAAGRPLKIYAVCQDVTAREDSRSAIERLNDQLRTREMTALAEHRLAAQLQQLIQPVPREPFALPGLRASVGYLPAESAVRVGGDWYHAQTLPDGRVALAIGDVAGHGLEAANGMAHLRFALVAWLSIGVRDPGEVMGHLNRLSVQLGLTGTAVFGVYDPAAGELRWARAGHPAPVLARAGAAAELPPPAGLLLGAVGDAPYPVATTPLRPGDLVLLYTDGLVERRSADIAIRLDLVKRALAEATAEPDALTAARGVLHQPSPDDDTCTLAVQVGARPARDRP